MNYQDATNFQTEMFDKIASLKSGYNEAQSDVLLGKGIINSVNLKPEALQSEKEKLFQQNLNAYLEKAETLTGAISYHRNTVLETLNKAKYPMLNSITSQDKLIGQLQIESALTLAQSQNFDLVLAELKSRYELGQIDFVSRLIDVINPSLPVTPKNDSQRILFDEAKKIRAEIERKNESDKMKVRLEAFDLALSKSQRLLNGLRSGAYLLYLIEDDIKHLGTKEAVEMLNFIENNFDKDQANKIKTIMFHNA